MRCDRATGGDWAAGYFDGLGHFVQTIKGETPAGDDYWSVWVNHKAAAAGACSTELQEGDEVLYFVDRCTFDGNGCSNDPVEPLGLTAPTGATTGAAGERQRRPLRRGRQGRSRSRARRSPARGSTRRPTPPARRP